MLQLDELAELGDDGVVEVVADQSCRTQRHEQQVELLDGPLGGSP